MGDINYHVVVQVYSGDQLVDYHEIHDEDYGFAMKRLSNWATNSEAGKDL